MREELTQFLGAEWGECSIERKGYRNGSSTRDAGNHLWSD
jgi:putative transposase